MSTEEVAKKLVDHCQKLQFREAVETLYSPNVVSVEAFEMPGSPMPREMRGIDAVRGKTDWWEANHTVHSCKVTGPFLAQDKFAVVLEIDATNKPSSKRFKMSEVATYTVADGKIVHEEFLMGSHGQA